MNSPHELWLRLDSATVLWLRLDSAMIMLKKSLYWMTSLDEEKKHVKNAIEELEQAKRILEAKS